MKRLPFLLLALAALTLFTARAAVDSHKVLATADSLYALGQLKASTALYQQAADSGLAQAQYCLAFAYYEGEGINRDYASAAKWFKRAARQEHAKAQYNLAYCYMNGRGVPRNYDRALELLNASANNACHEAYVTLAECYEKGVLVAKDSAQAAHWSSLASGKEVPQPVAENPKPVVEVPAPIVEEKKPEVEETKPVVEEAKPVVTEEPKPIVEETKPAVAEEPKAMAAKEQPAEEGSQEMSQEDVLKAIGGVLAGIGEESATAAKPIVAQPRKTAPTDTLAAPAEEHAPVIVYAPGKEPKEAPKAPKLNILFPKDSSAFHTRQIKLKYQLVAGPLADSTKVFAFVDGVRQSDDRAVRQPGTIDVDLPQHDCTVMLYAANRMGNSEPVSIRLVRENVEQVTLPKLFAVVVGVGKYDDEKLPSLRLTTKDAHDFAAAVASKKGLPFNDVQVKLLTDEEATRADIFEAMQWLAEEASPYDVCMFFFAGHGYKDERDRFYFMNYGAHTDKLYNCFSAQDFRSVADEIHSKLLVFADACFSGALLEGNRSAAAAHFVEQLSRSKNGMLLYASSAGDTKSKEDPAWGNGAFTKALVEAFGGAARQEGETGLSTQELEMYLYRAVRKTTDFKQTPVFINPGGVEHFSIFNYEP